MSQLDSKWISRTEDFFALREEWQELLNDSSSNTLFLTWEWQYTWWLHLAEKRQLAILTIRKDGILMAIAPMTVKPADLKRMMPFKILEILGTGTVGSDYLSIIVRNDAERRLMPAISVALLNRKYSLEMSNTERDSKIMTKVVLEMNGLGCRSGRSTQSFSPFIDLSGFNWDSYMTRNNSSNRTRFNKKLRKLEKTFSVRFDQTNTEASLEMDLQTLIQLHLQRWDGKGGTNAFNSVSLRNFHKEFSAIALKNNWLRLYIMWLDNKPAAAVYGFCYNDIFYYYQAGFNPQFSQYSVGYLAIGQTVKKALEEGVREYDMLRGNESYKYVWATNERELVRLNIFQPTSKGRACEQYMALRNSAKAMIIDNLPPMTSSEALRPNLTD